MKGNVFAAVFGFMVIVSSSSPLQAVEPSCSQVQVDYTRDCGAIIGQRSLYRLEPSECVEIEVDASSHWNASGILFEEGESYQIEVGVPSLSKDQKKALKEQCEISVEATEFGEIKQKMVWCDSTVQATVEGWCTPCSTGEVSPACEKCNAPTGIMGWTIAQLAKLRRYKDPQESKDGLFYLVGAVTGREPMGPLEQFPIGAGGITTMPMTGEFCSFANDLSFKYGNNLGFLRLRITRQKIAL